MELIRLRVPAASLCSECYTLRPLAIDWINVIQKHLLDRRAASTAGPIYLLRRSRVHWNL